MVDLSLKHDFHSARPASNDATKIDGPKWNDEHVLLQSAAGFLGSTEAGPTDLLSSAQALSIFPQGSAGYALMGNGADAPSYQGFQQSGAGAITRAWQDKGREVVSIVDYGAVAGTNTSGVRAANAAAIVAAWTANPYIFIPSGTFYCNPIVAPASARGAYGVGNTTSIITSTTLTAGQTLLTAALSSSFSLDRLAVLANVDASTTTKGVEIGGSASGAVTNCRISGSSALNVFVTVDYIAANNVIAAWREIGILCGGSRAKITGNSVLPAFNNSGSHGIWVLNGNDIQITNNLVDKPAFFGIAAIPQGGDIKGLVIANNRVKGNTNEAIAVDTISGSLSDFVIANNVCSWDDYNTTVDYGVDLVVPAGPYTVTRGTISGNTIRKPGKAGILLTAASAGLIKHVNVVGNTIIDPGWYSGNVANEKRGIVLDSATDCHVADNIVNDTLGNIIYAIQEFGSADLNTYSNNHLGGYATGEYNLAGASSVVYKGGNFRHTNHAYGFGTNIPTARLHVYGSDQVGPDTLLGQFNSSDFVSGVSGSGFQIEVGSATGDSNVKLKAFKTGFAAWGNLVLQDTYLLTNGGAFSPLANDGAALGSSALSWSDLFLAPGAVITFDNGDVTLTHSANTLTMAGGALALGTPLGVASGGTNYTGGAFTSYTPAITTGSGTITTSSATGAYLQIGKLVIVRLSITITTNGSGATNLRASLPVDHVTSQGGFCGQNQSNGKAVQGSTANTGPSLVVLFNSDGTGYPVSGDGQTIVVTGIYEAA